MKRQESFTKYENRLLPSFRRRIGQAESTEDVRKFFVYTVTELFSAVFEDRLAFSSEDVALSPDADRRYTVSERLMSRPEFSTVWRNSDLPHVLSRLAETAVSRYRHLEKHPEKTDAKIRMER